MFDEYMALLRLWIEIYALEVALDKDKTFRYFQQGVQFFVRLTVI